MISAKQGSRREVGTCAIYVAPLPNANVITNVESLSLSVFNIIYKLFVIVK